MPKYGVLRSSIISFGEFASGCGAYFGSAGLYSSYTSGIYEAGPALILTILVPVEFLLLFLAWRRIDRGSTRLLKIKLLVGPILFLPALFGVLDLRSGVISAVEDWLMYLPILLIDVHITPFGWALDFAILIIVFAEEVLLAIRGKLPPFGKNESQERPPSGS